MDKLYDYGLSELFLLISLAVAKKSQINLDFSHLDSSSFSVHGQYNQALASLKKSQSQESEVEPIAISITHGYSRDHRPDLKQFILDLIVTKEQQNVERGFASWCAFPCA
jgi:transposase